MQPIQPPTRQTNQSIPTPQIGSSGAEKYENSLFVENFNAARILSFSSRANCTAAIRVMAPPKMANTNSPHNNRVHAVPTSAHVLSG